MQRGRDHADVGDDQHGRDHHHENCSAQRRTDHLASGRSGAQEYLELAAPIGNIAEFRAAIATIAAGGTCIDAEVVATMLARRRASPLDGLTERERDVLALMAKGRSNAEIAGSLYLSEAGIAKHVRSLLAKLGLPAETHGNRRVRAVLAWLDSERESS